MDEYLQHFIEEKESVLIAFKKLNNTPLNLTLFVLDENNRLLGTLTDGDIRRGFLNGLQLTDNVGKFMNRSFRFLKHKEFEPKQISLIKKSGVKLLPVIDDNGKIQSVIDFNRVKTILPVDAVLMAGGRGERLRPVTDSIPKPLLKVGNKTIIEYNLDLLSKYGISNYFITLRYLAEQIEQHLGDGKNRGIKIEYIKENEPLGTIGSISLIKEFLHDHILLMNSDLFTNIDLEDFYQNFIDEDAHMSVATIPYNVDVPYAVLNLEDNVIKSFKEKPSYTYHSNAGIYLIKKDLFDNIPVQKAYNATDFIQALIDSGKKVVRYPLIGYWIDIGKPEDFLKAQEIAEHLNSLG